MFKTIVVMFERASSVVWWIDKDALDLPCKLLLQRLEGEEIISKDKAVVEYIVVCDSVWGVIRSFRVFKKDARLQPWPVLLPNPGQFELCFVDHVDFQTPLAFSQVEHLW
jgi:hypothetical protein